MRILCECTSRGTSLNWSSASEITTATGLCRKDALFLDDIDDEEKVMNVRFDIASLDLEQPPSQLTGGLHSSQRASLPTKFFFFFYHQGEGTVNSATQSRQDLTKGLLETGVPITREGQESCCGTPWGIWFIECIFSSKELRYTRRLRLYQSRLKHLTKPHSNES